MLSKRKSADTKNSSTRFLALYNSKSREGGGTRKEKRMT